MITNRPMIGLIVILIKIPPLDDGVHALMDVEILIRQVFIKQRQQCFQGIIAAHPRVVEQTGLEGKGQIDHAGINLHQRFRAFRKPGGQLLKPDLFRAFGIVGDHATLWRQILKQLFDKVFPAVVHTDKLAMGQRPVCF